VSDLLDAVVSKVTDAIYHERDHGGTMDTAGESAAIVALEIVTAYLLSPEVVERAADNIWPLANLSSDEARAELRRDTRAALASALGVET
jgi:hypothetical protein